MIDCVWTVHDLYVVLVAFVWCVACAVNVEFVLCCSVYGVYVGTAFHDNPAAWQ